MKWHHVAENWPAFFDAIQDRWPNADEGDLDGIDGDQHAFVRYIADLSGQPPGEVREEILEWLSGELPSDVIMDPRHDNHSINLSAKFVSDGEEESDDDARFGDDGQA